MNTLNISENIIRLRREKKVTQEELADFVGVTKASVSKWENKQSMPDILLLPQLAAFFDVTIDELVGYKPQLSSEQIQKIYQDLASGFASGFFDETMGKSRDLVKQYYCCYPFLYHICLLWLNHFMLAEEREKQIQVLEETAGLCGRILKECKDIRICSDTVLLQSYVNLQLGKVSEVIENLKDIAGPIQLAGQENFLLVQAYLMEGNQERADYFSQVSMYAHIVGLISSATQYLEIHKNDLEICEETMRRIDTINEAYGMRRLNANSEALFHAQAAVVSCIHGKKEEALERLHSYARAINWLLEGDHLEFGGDSYFYKLDELYNNSVLGNRAPRDKKIIRDSALSIFSHEAFSLLKGEKEFENIQRSIR